MVRFGVGGCGERVKFEGGRWDAYVDVAAKS